MIRKPMDDSKIGVLNSDTNTKSLFLTPAQLLAQAGLLALKVPNLPSKKVLAPAA